MPSPRMKTEECPICNHHTFASFFSLHDVPVQDGVLWNSLQEALSAPTGNIELAFCNHCGYIGNLLFEPAKIRYDQEYSFSLQFSPLFQDFMKTVASRLVAEYELQHKRILEIGCGQGDFLRLICGLGHNCGIGIDPSVDSHIEQLEQGHITFEQGLYTEKYANLDVDFVCCRQVLDQIAHPRAFVELVRSNLGERTDSVLYFEVPNAANIFEDLLIRNIIYEKCSWFTLRSIARLFELSSFKVVRAEPCFDGGQYIGIEAVPSSGEMNEHHADDASLNQFAQSISVFGERYNSKVRSWKERLSSAQLSGKRIIAWGAGSGAINFFNTLNIQREIPYVVDINPKRQGKFLPLTGQQVVSPEFILEYGAELVLITNSTYEDEIKRQVAAMGATCDFWAI